MSAKIDGKDWSSDGVIFSTYLGNVLGVSGGDRTQPTRAIAFSVQITQPGEVQINQTLGTANAVISVGSEIWQASVLGGTGTIKVTSLTSTGATGTFSFEAVAAPNSGNSGTKDVTDGKFEVTFTTTAAMLTPAPARAAGPSPTAAVQPAGTCAGAVTGTANGGPWCGSGFVRASHSNGFFSLAAFDATAGAITFGLGQVTGPGTYSVTYLNPNGSSVIVATPLGQGWNTFLPGGTGTVTIDVLTATRAAGTFSFEAVGATGGASGKFVLTDGKFDVALAVSPGAATATPSAQPTTAPPLRGANTAIPASAGSRAPAATVGVCNGAVTAKVNGAPWCGAISVLASHRNNAFSLTAFDAAAVGLTFQVVQVTAPGTYSVAYLNGTISSAMAGNSSGQSWNTLLPGGTGTVIIETLTTTRATGTFSFEAAAASGGATGKLTVTDGKFDVALQVAASK